jgi:hypothetical protein
MSDGLWNFYFSRFFFAKKKVFKNSCSYRRVRGLAIFFNTYGEKSTTQLTLILIRSTFYNFAKHLEKKGDISSAIQNYEKSGTHRFEVPRLLFEDWNILEAYIQVIYYENDIFFINYLRNWLFFRTAFLKQKLVWNQRRKEEHRANLMSNHYRQRLK